MTSLVPSPNHKLTYTKINLIFGRLSTMTFEPLLSEIEAAKFLGGLHPKTVQRMARRGELPAYRVGRYWRFRASELDQWLRVESRCQWPPAQN
jgi:excisionase family DNA binding protein